MQQPVYLASHPACCTPSPPRAPPSLPAERALNTYCGLHRLLLALCDRHGLWERAERRVGRFLSQEAHRTKEQAPNLGLLVPLLALSRKHDWHEVGGRAGVRRACERVWEVVGCGTAGEIFAHAPPARTIECGPSLPPCWPLDKLLLHPAIDPTQPFPDRPLVQVLPVVLGECLDRQVLWACKADRSLIERYRVGPERGGVDGRLVAGAFEASKVALRWVGRRGRGGGNGLLCTPSGGAAARLAYVGRSSGYWFC